MNSLINGAVEVVCVLHNQWQQMDVYSSIRDSGREQVSERERKRVRKSERERARER